MPPRKGHVAVKQELPDSTWELDNALQPQHPLTEGMQFLLALSSLCDHVRMKRESCCVEGGRKVL